MTRSLTVVVPVYGLGPHLEEVVCAVEGQLSDGDRIILSHSGDGDPTARFASNSRVGVLHSGERLFAGAARNRGLDVALTDWVAFIDEDIVPAAGWYSALQRAIAANEAECIIGSIGYQESGGYWGIALWFTEFGSVHYYMPKRVLTGGPSANMAVRRKPFVDAGAFPEDWRSSEELYAQARLIAAGGRMTFVPDMLGRHFNQRGMRNALSHLYLYGRFGARLRRVFPSLPGANAVRFPLLSLGMWLARASQMTRRVLTSPEAPKGQFLLHLPGIIACLIAWNISFSREAFSRAEEVRN